MTDERGKRRRFKTFDEYVAEHVTADPYLAALYEATKDVPPDRLDDVLEAFPEPEEWERQRRDSCPHGAE